MKLRFKKVPQETGLAGIGYPHQSTEIKGDGKVIGMISAPNWQTDNEWRIRFTVKDESNWKWISLKKKTNTEQEARDFIKEVWTQLQEKYDFRQDET